MVINPSLHLMASRLGYTYIQIPENSDLDGKSAYEIATENGFIGTEQEWLQWISPHIGENGNWFVQDIDSGIPASQDLDGYWNEQNFMALTDQEILEICK